MKTETLAATAIEVKPKRRRSFYREYEALILGGSAVLIVLAAWKPSGSTDGDTGWTRNR